MEQQNPQELIQSDEELYFSWWAEQLKAAGYIREIIYQPKSVELSTQVTSTYHEPFVKKAGYKEVIEEMLSAHVYTPDVKIIWEEKALGVFTMTLECTTRKKQNRSFQTIISHRDKENNLYSIVEVKPAFDQNNMTREAKINIKWVWSKYEIFVNLIIPEKHFEKTFTPTRFFYTNKSGQVRKIKYKSVLTMDEYILKKQK